MLPKRFVAVAVLAALTSGWSTPAAAVEALSTKRPDRPLAMWESYHCGPATATPVRDDRPVTVRYPPSTLTVGSVPASMWSSPPSTSPTWRMNFYSLSWLRPVVRSAYENDQRNVMNRALAQVEAFYIRNPDTGRSEKGWDEGTSLRRLETLTCLYTLTKDARLAKRMSTEVDLLFGPRYLGPPLRRVHNHGLMANMFISRAGDLLGRRAWVQRAQERVRRESHLAFSAKGVSMEQSAAYHGMNLAMWTTAVTALEASDPKDVTVKQIKATLTRARAVAPWFTEPDGNLVQVGDSTLSPGVPPTGKERPGVSRDDESGWLIGRSSWSSRAATAYTLRYGPGRFAHGHNDKGSLTWTTAGARVLVDPGYHNYDWTDPMSVRARAFQAHNTSWPLRGQFSEAARATLSGTKARKRGVEEWVIRDATHGVAHSRLVAVNDRARSVTVTDTYSRRTGLRQAWHLAPEWSYVGRSGRALSFTNPSGRRLTVTTTGATGRNLWRGSTKPLAGWVHPKVGVARPAWELVFDGAGSVTTTFHVR